MKGLEEVKMGRDGGDGVWCDEEEGVRGEADGKDGLREGARLRHGLQCALVVGEEVAGVATGHHHEGGVRADLVVTSFT